MKPAFSSLLDSPEICSYAGRPCEVLKPARCEIQRRVAEIDEAFGRSQSAHASYYRMNSLPDEHRPSNAENLHLELMESVLVMEMGANADKLGSSVFGDADPNGRILRELCFPHQESAK